MKIIELGKNCALNNKYKYKMKFLVGLRQEFKHTVYYPLVSRVSMWVRFSFVTSNFPMFFITQTVDIITARNEVAAR